jgi:hypothetical protein
MTGLATSSDLRSAFPWFRTDLHRSIAEIESDGEFMRLADPPTNSRPRRDELRMTGTAAFVTSEPIKYQLLLTEPTTKYLTGRAPQPQHPTRVPQSTHRKTEEM